MQQGEPNIDKHSLAYWSHSKSGRRNILVSELIGMLSIWSTTYS